MDAKAKEKIKKAVINSLDWKEPVYEISAIDGQGTGPLIQDLMIYIEENDLRV